MGSPNEWRVPSSGQLLGRIEEIAGQSVRYNSSWCWDYGLYRSKVLGKDLVR